MFSNVFQGIVDLVYVARGKVSHSVVFIENSRLHDLYQFISALMWLPMHYEP